MIRFAQFVFALALVLCMSAASQAGGFSSFRSFGSPVVIERQVVRGFNGRPVVVERFVSPGFSFRQVESFRSPQRFRVESFNLGGCR
jgi:hypothetical protein